MTRRLALALAVFAGAIATGCAGLLGIPADTLSFCSQNTGHSFCADFDIGPPNWTQGVNFGSGQLAVEPSDAAPSPPNVADLTAGPVPTSGGSSVAAFYASLDAGFSTLHVEAQMLFRANGGAPVGPTGIFVISDSKGGCVVAAAQQTGSRVGVTGFPIPAEAHTASGTPLCSALIDGTVGGGTDGGGLDGYLAKSTLIGTLFVDAWQEVTIDVALVPDGGTLTMSSGPTGNSAMPIPGETFPSGGTPIVVFSNAAQPGSSATDVQIDNVTIDVH